MSTTKCIFANDLLMQVMENRNWHEGKIERRLAFEYKKRAAKGELSYEKACSILELLGYNKLKPETWKIPE